MRKKIQSAIALLLVGATVLSGCQHSTVKNTSSDYTYEITVDVYDTLANFQGIQSGWFAKVVKDKFNMRLNIIAPNVSGTADTLYETRFATGDIGDLIICSATAGKLQNMVDAGLVIDMTPYLEGKDVIKKYNSAINALNSLVVQDGVYAVPSQISNKSATTPSEGDLSTYGSYLRWDAYQSLGRPKVATLEDLLPLLKDMQRNTPYSDSGEKTYAFSLFSDWDGNLMNAIKQPCCFYGYDESGFVLASADGRDFQNILDPNGLYMRVLKFYFNANQMGLIDPDSKTQNYSDVFKKFADGQILFSPWPWLGQSAYNTTANMNQGKGYMFVPIEDEKIYSNGCKPYGNFDTVIAVGSKAEDPARLVDFINWLYSPDGIAIGGAQKNLGTAGPKGLTWELKDSGPELTELGYRALIKGDDVKLPQKYGSGTWTEGVSQLNYNPVSKVESDDYGFPYYYNLWDSVNSYPKTKLDTVWKEFSGSDTVMNYLKIHNQLSVAPGGNYTAKTESTELSTIRTQCAKLVVDYSWKMVFAKNEAEFNSLWQELLTREKSLGYDNVYAYDLENAKARAAANEEVK